MSQDSVLTVRETGSFAAIAEYLNGDVKQGVHSKPPTRNLSQLKQRISSHLHKLQKLPERIRKYFEHPFIAYAAQ